MMRRSAPLAPVFFAGIAPGNTGTGQLVRWLFRQGCDVVFRDESSRSVRDLIRTIGVAATIRRLANLRLSLSKFDIRWRLEAISDFREVILLHPQTIGMRRVVEFIRRRRRPPILYLLDCGFFCIQSYNYLEGASGPCLQCLGGQFERSVKNGCQPFPVNDPDADWFVRELLDLVGRGRLQLMAQNRAQARLASQHFGVEVPVVGLWTADWDELFATDEACELSSQADGGVVFHGHCLGAKGADWLIRVAGRCPDVSFLFPCGPQDGSGDLPPNCEFRPMSWGTGLAQAVSDAAVVVVPSLWSAPIESALIKSLVHARVVAVVENPTAFASEIPDDIVLRLPVDPSKASERLRSAAAGDWQPNRVSLDRFLAAFFSTESAFLESVEHCCGPQPPRRSTTVNAGARGVRDTRVDHG